MQQDVHDAKSSAGGSGLDLLFQASQLSENLGAVKQEEVQGDVAVPVLSNVTSDSVFSNSKSNVNSSAKVVANASAIDSHCESHFDDENDVKMVAHQDVGGDGDADLDGGTVVSMTHSDHGQDNDQNDPERNERGPSPPSSPKPPYSPSSPSSRHSRTFPQLLHLMLASPSNFEIVSWLPSGDGFVIRQPRLFASKVLPVYFRKTALESFVRKLNRWGFRRVKLPFTDHCSSDWSGEGTEETNGSKEVPTQSAFAHKYFLRDDPRLCAKMFCRSKPSCSLEMSTAAAAGLKNAGGGGRADAIPSSSAEVSVVSNCTPVIASSSGDLGLNFHRGKRPDETDSVPVVGPKFKRVKREAKDDDVPSFLPYGISPSQIGLDLEHEERRDHTAEHADLQPQHADPSGPSPHAKMNSYGMYSQVLEPSSFHNFPNEQKLQCGQQHQQQHNYLLMHQLEMRMRMRMHWQRKRQLQWQLQIQMLGMAHGKLQGHLPVPSSMALPTSMLPISSSTFMPTSSVQTPMQEHIKSSPFLLSRPQSNGLDIDTTSNHLSQKQQHFPPLFCTTATQKSREYLRNHYILR